VIIVVTDYYKEEGGEQAMSRPKRKASENIRFRFDDEEEEEEEEVEHGQDEEY